MKKYWKLFVIVAVLVATIAFAGMTAVFAQGPNQPAVPAPGAANQGQIRGGMGYMAVEESEMHSAIAVALGITVTELESEIAQGKTLYELAAEMGVDFAAVQTAMQAAHAAALQQALAGGAITQAQANWLQSRGGGRQGKGGSNAGGLQANRGVAIGDCVYQTP